jgi:siroheme synthase
MAITRTPPETAFKTYYGEVIHHEPPVESPRAARRGKCTRVEVGAGGVAQLSAAALQAIGSATVVLVEPQVGAAVLALAPAAARVVRVDARTPGRPAPQAFAERVIQIALRDGEQVVHLLRRAPPAPYQ